MAVRGLAGPCARRVLPVRPGTRLPGTRFFGKVAGTRLPAQGYHFSKKMPDIQTRTGTRSAQGNPSHSGQFGARSRFRAVVDTEMLANTAKHNGKYCCFVAGPISGRGRRHKVSGTRSHPPPPPRHKVTPPRHKVAQGLMRGIRGRRGSRKQPYRALYRALYR